MVMVNNLKTNSISKRLGHGTRQSGLRPRPSDFAFDKN
jgi:hypothetical protein